MPKGNPQFNCLGFKKRKSQFRPLAELRAEEFSPPDDLPADLRGPIISAFRHVLRGSFSGKLDTDKD